jgi:HPt (histidine-containing phosphotransfer) domain-containing protein
MTQNKTSGNLHSLAYFERIGMDENEFLERVIETLQKDLPQLQSGIIINTENQSWKQLSSLAHKLKSSFMMLSLDVKPCLELEMLAKSEHLDIEKMRELSKIIVETLTKVIFELQENYKK